MLDKLHLIYLSLFILNFPSPVHDSSLFSLYFVTEQITCARKHIGCNSITCTSYFSWEGGGCPVQLLAVCHKKVSSPNEGDGEILLNNWAPQFMDKKKYQVCSLVFFHDSAMPPHLDKFLFKTANGAAYRIALSLYGQEALP